MKGNFKINILIDIKTLKIQKYKNIKQSAFFKNF